MYLLQYNLKQHNKLDEIFPPTEVHYELRHIAKIELISFHLYQIYFVCFS